MEVRKVPERHVALVEAVLFSTGEPLSAEQIAKMANIRLENVQAALDILKIKYLKLSQLKRCVGKIKGLFSSNTYYRKYVTPHNWTSYPPNSFFKYI